MMAHLFLIGAKVKQEIHNQFYQPLLNNCQIKKQSHHQESVTLDLQCQCVAFLRLNFLPSPFFGPLIPSSAARSEG